MQLNIVTREKNKRTKEHAFLLLFAQPFFCVCVFVKGGRVQQKFFFFFVHRQNRSHDVQIQWQKKVLLINCFLSVFVTVQKSTTGLHEKCFKQKGCCRITRYRWHVPVSPVFSINELRKHFCAERSKMTEEWPDKNVFGDKHNCPPQPKSSNIWRIWGNFFFYFSFLEIMKPSAKSDQMRGRPRLNSISRPSPLMRDQNSGPTLMMPVNMSENFLPLVILRARTSRSVSVLCGDVSVSAASSRDGVSTVDARCLLVFWLCNEQKASDMNFRHEPTLQNIWSIDIISLGKETGVSMKTHLNLNEK